MERVFLHVSSFLSLSSTVMYFGHGVSQDLVIGGYVWNGVFSS